MASAGVVELSMNRLTGVLPASWGNMSQVNFITVGAVGRAVQHPWSVWGPLLLGATAKGVQAGRQPQRRRRRRGAGPQRRLGTCVPEAACQPRPRAATLPVAPSAPCRRPCLTTVCVSPPPPSCTCAATNMLGGELPPEWGRLRSLRFLSLVRVQPGCLSTLPSHFNHRFPSTATAREHTRLASVCIQT